jgi:hypothetical protein
MTRTTQTDAEFRDLLKRLFPTAHLQVLEDLKN